MAHKKAAGSTKNGRDSASQRRGVKVFGGEKVIAGNIIVRQKGNKFFAGNNVSEGRDFTLYARTEGVVSFEERKMKKFDGRIFKDVVVHVS